MSGTLRHRLRRVGRAFRTPASRSHELQLRQQLKAANDEVARLNHELESWRDMGPRMEDEISRLASRVADLHREVTVRDTVIGRLSVAPMLAALKGRDDGRN